MTNYIDSKYIKVNIDKYTNFQFGGYKVHLPYHLGGKESPNTIKSKLLDLCGGEEYKLSKSEIQSKATNNPSKCGIDCSGFVLRTANESTNNQNVILNYFSEIAYTLNNNFPKNDLEENRYRWGIGAFTLTNKKYSRKVKNIINTKAGDFIRFDNGKHVAIVKSVKINYDNECINYIIEYSHSSKNAGVHNAYIMFNLFHIDDLTNLSLTNGYWNDWNKSYSITIRNLYNYICRPNCLN